MIGAIGDPHLKSVDRLAARLVADGQLKRAKAGELIARPAEIADPTQRGLKPMRHGLGDQRRYAEGGAIAEIVAVDHAEIDAARPAVCDHMDRAIQIERYAERSGEAVGGAERKQREDAIMPDEIVDGGG